VQCQRAELSIGGLAPSAAFVTDAGTSSKQLWNFQKLLLQSMTVSVNPTGVPDAGSTLPLLGFASLGLVALRRKLSC